MNARSASPVPRLLPPLLLFLALASVGAPLAAQACSRPVHALGTVLTGGEKSCHDLQGGQDYQQYCPTDTCACYELEVACPRMSGSSVVNVKVTTPPVGEASQGTVVLMGGGCGAGLWETLTIDDAPPPAREALRYLNETAHFTTVQLVYPFQWCDGEDGEVSGYSGFACRIATALTWVYNNIHAADTESGFCLTGNSGGSDVMGGYTLSHYGLWDVVDLAVPTSGPVHADMQAGCFGAAGGYDNFLKWGLEQRKAVDRGYGYPQSSSEGPCVLGDLSFSEVFGWDGAASTHPKACYFYPTTKVVFIAGEEDGFNGPDHQALVYDRLVAAGSDAELRVVPGVGHKVPGHQAGADEIVAVLEESCAPQGEVAAHRDE